MVSAKIESGRADGNQPGPEFHHKQRSGTLDEGRLRIIDHHLAEGEAGDRDELQIGNRQGNTDDGDGLEESRDDMSDCQPDTGNEKPDQIHQRRTSTSSRHRDNSFTEGPDNVARNAERGDTRRDRHDENTREQSEKDVVQEQYETAETSQIILSQKRISFLPSSCTASSLAQPSLNSRSLFPWFSPDFPLSRVATLMP